MAFSIYVERERERQKEEKKEKGKKANFLSYVRKNANLHKRYAVQFITFHTRALPRCSISFNSETNPIPAAGTSRRQPAFHPKTLTTCINLNRSITPV